MSDVTSPLFEKEVKHYESNFRSQHKLDYVDKSELEFIKSTVQLITRKQFEEKARQNEIAASRILGKQPYKTRMEEQDKKLCFVKSLCEISKRTRDLGLLSVVDLNKQDPVTQLVNQNAIQKEWKTVKREAIDTFLLHFNK
ncbi:lysophospholipase [Acrasis kona]|uniref:Lysophospholipase n=1 Tax=Acrasis kona TaxID=1008807 RepID=A0AAW2Z206_9EUKA